MINLSSMCRCRTVYICGIIRQEKSMFSLVLTSYNTVGDSNLDSKSWSINRCSINRTSLFLYFWFVIVSLCWILCRKGKKMKNNVKIHWVYLRGRATISNHLGILNVTFKREDIFSESLISVWFYESWSLFISVYFINAIFF